MKDKQTVRNKTNKFVIRIICLILAFSMAAGVIFALIQFLTEI